MIDCFHFALRRVLPQVLLIFNFISYLFHSFFFLLFCYYGPPFVLMACNIIFRDYYSRYFFFFLFSGCGARMGRVFFWYIFACSCFGLENIPRVDTHVRLIVRRAYRETCVTINDDGKVDCGGSATRGRDDHHISVRVLEMLRGDGNGEEKRVFFSFSQRQETKKGSKKEKKRPIGLDRNL